MWVFALFLMVPLIEIALFIKVGGWLTLWPTLAIVVGTGILGVFVVRKQGLKALAEMQTAMRTQQNPVAPMANGALIVVAGFLLMSPGFLTDTLGFLLLVPPLRQWMISLIAGRMGLAPRRGPAPDWRDSGRFSRDADVIDAEYSEVDPDHPARRDASRWTQD